MVEHTFHPSTWEAEVGGSQWVCGQPGLTKRVLGQPGLYTKKLCLEKKKKRNEKERNEKRITYCFPRGLRIHSQHTHEAHTLWLRSPGIHAYRQANVYTHKGIKWINENVGCRRGFLDTRFNLSWGRCRGSGVVLKVREDSFLFTRERTHCWHQWGGPILMEMLEHDWVKGNERLTQGATSPRVCRQVWLGMECVWGRHLLFFLVCDRAFSSVSGWLQSHYVAQAGLKLMMSPQI